MTTETPPQQYKQARHNPETRQNTPTSKMKIEKKTQLYSNSVAPKMTANLNENLAFDTPLK